MEAASGILLLFMAVIALVWANSPWASTYEHLLHTPVSLGIGDYAFERPGHGRYPVCDASGEVLGVLNVTDLATADPDAGIDALLRPVMKVPESLLVPTLLRNMQAERLRVAVVVDEYGNTTGLVTVVDLIEEIVGVLGDEETAREPELHREEEGVYLISGVLPVSRAQRELGIELPEQPNARTVSGWLAAHLGRLPRVGDEVPVPGGTVKVERVVNHRADRIRVVVEDPDASQDPEVPS